VGPREGEGEGVGGEGVGEGEGVEGEGVGGEGVGGEGVGKGKGEQDLPGSSSSSLTRRGLRSPAGPVVISLAAWSLACSHRCQPASVVLSPLVSS
jgi:hypothetical protein